MSADFNHLFHTITELVLCHSPSGAEQEIDRALLDKFAAIRVETWQDQAGNVIAKIPGKRSDSAMAITAHKDEIGTLVKRIGEDGTLEVRRLGGSFPWVYGEGVMDILGDRAVISGIVTGLYIPSNREKPPFYSLRTNMAYMMKG